MLGGIITLSRRCLPKVQLAVAWSVAAPVAARAHEPETLDFARPESWGMKYYASLALLSGMGVPHALRAGELELGLEGGYVPQLSDMERRIGFHGKKLEDVNKTSVFGRVRGSVGEGRAPTLDHLGNEGFLNGRLFVSYRVN